MLSLEESLLPWFEPGLWSDPSQTAPQPPSPPDTGSDGIDLDRVLEERRVRRKISNRESARRSRARKQRRLQELTDEADRLVNENRVLRHHLSDLTHGCCLLLLDNERLGLETGSLRLRLGDLTTVLALRQQQISTLPTPTGCAW